ncbi:M28 family peptidase [Geodermatophilus sp. CPCC 205761]|uniref:M28 family peptidase n=1 Tax=Geodermatophilus sp. CPCC 205761 TaxID=2936597 RepID=UPI003EED73AF
MVDRRTGTAGRTARRVAAAGAGGLLVALALPAGAAVAGGGHGCEHGDNDSFDELLECMTADGVLEHLEAFQKIADNSTDPVYPGTRAAGTDGYADSVEYVAGLLREAGYEVTLDPVQITFNFPAELRQLTPTAAEYETGVFTGSGSGRIDAGQVVPVDVNLEGDRASTSGCEAEDFAGLDLSGPADIALIQRGTCSFGLKAQNADQAGAEAVIVFNQGNSPDREALFIGDAQTLDLEGTMPATYDIPVVGASFAEGVALAQPGSTAFVEVLPAETRTDHNVIAELPGENRDNVVMAGAHLDSVIEGPGINDNGSGSAALLETALLMAEGEHENTLRFGWWAAEEQGLVGSADYVAGLSQAERDRIALYMNYDMVGSPNYVFMVYDADQSTFPAPEGVPIPEGSTAIEDVYESYYTLVGEPYDDTEFSGRSDYEAFILAGIPSSGLFTGAEGIKTEPQAAIWGGTAGEQYDPCYHLACDTIENLDRHALDVNSDLIAFAMLTFAYSTEPVNGVEGRDPRGGPVELPAPAGPEGTFVEAGGGAAPGAVA